MIRINTPNMILDEKLLKIHQPNYIYAGNSTPLSPLTFLSTETNTVDIDELANYIETVKRYGVSSLTKSIDDVMNEYKNAAFFMNATIGENRINNGYKAGIIDIVKDAYRLTDDGWVNSNKDIVMQKDVSLEEFRDYIEYHCEIIPFLTESDLEEFNESGVVNVKGKIIARNNGSEWVMEDTGRHLYGDALRVLHHSDAKVIIGNNPVEQELYHSVVIPEDEFEISKGKFFGYVSRGISAQGDGFYMTKSQDEAIRIYGNPRSFERRSVPHALERPELMHKVYRGMLYKLNTTKKANIYDANFCTDQPSFCMDSKPSAHLLKVLTDQYELDDRVAAINISKTLALCDQNTNQFGVYMAISEFCNTLAYSSKKHQSKNPIGKIFEAMGYDGIQLSAPDSAAIKSIEDVITQIDREHGEFYNEVLDKGCNPQHISTMIQSYLQKIKNIDIPKLQIGHVIIFNANNDLVSLKESIELPVHKGFVTKNEQDNFYDLNKGNLNKITTKQIEKLTKESLSEYRKGNHHREINKSELAP